jgi:hypothetical protein
MLHYVLLKKEVNEVFTTFGDTTVCIYGYWPLTNSGTSVDLLAVAHGD